MTIHVDDPMPVGGKFHNYCHMWADGTLETLNELYAFADRLGLQRSWRQYSKGLTGDFYHYDISPNMRAKALRMGAEYISLAEWLKPRWEAYKAAQSKVSR